MVRIVGGRYIPGAQLILSAAFTLLGGIIVATPERLVAANYHYTFQVIGPRTWGWTFIIICGLAFGGIIAPVWPNHPGRQAFLARILCGGQLGLMAVWGLHQLAASIFQGVSFVGPTVWLTMAIVQGYSIWRWGTGRAA